MNSDTDKTNNVFFHMYIHNNNRCIQSDDNHLQQSFDQVSELVVIIIAVRISAAAAGKGMTNRLFVSLLTSLIIYGRLLALSPIIAAIVQNQS